MIAPKDDKQVDILLISLPVYNIPNIDINEMVDYYSKPYEMPSGLLSIASFLFENGVISKIIPLDCYIHSRANALADSIYIIGKHIGSHNPCYIGISISYKLQESFSCKLIESIVKKWPRLKILIGGSHVSVSETAYKIYKNIIIIRGEGEQAVLDIIKYKQECHIHRRLPESKANIKPFTERLNNIPQFHYELLSMPTEIHLTNFTHYLQTSRGCTGKCYFCTSPIVWSGGIVMKRLDIFSNEVDSLYKLGVNIIDLDDDVISFNNAHLLHITSITKNYSDIAFPVMTRMDLLTKENLSIMATSNIKTIYIGIESTQDCVLKAMNKRLNPQKHMYLLEYAHEQGVRIGSFWMFAHPGSNKYLDMKSIEDMYNLFKNKVIDEASIGIFLPIPGTISYQHPQVVLLDVPCEMWTGMKPVHRLVDGYGKIVYHENEIEEVTKNAIKILREFNIDNNKVYV